MKLIGIIGIILGLGILPSDVKVVQEYRMDGKYGLYAKLNGENWELLWMTPKAESGVVYAVGSEKSLAKTTPSTIHKVTIPVESESKKIRFGGVESGLSTLDLKTEFDRAPFNVSGVDSIYVFGDTHGNFDHVIGLLKDQKIINEQLEWTGGNAHLVFVGDILDRGKDAIRLIWFIYDLEADARTKGGSVHMVLGNHEIMVMSNDIRYVSPKEKQIAMLYGEAYGMLFHPQQTLLGRWLTSKPAVLKIDNVIFAHGGLILENKLEEINDQTYDYLQKAEFTHIKEDFPDLEKYSEKDLKEINDFFFSSYSPFWYRGYVQSDTTGAYLDYVLTKNKGKLHVVGHTSRPNIEERFKGKLIATNVHEAGSELLLLVKKKRKYDRFRINMEGKVEEL